VTREPYGYTTNNPLNAVDPLGLSKCGQLSLGGLVDCASKVDDAAGGTVSAASDTLAVVGGLAGWGLTYGLDAGVNGTLSGLNWVNNNFAFNAGVCPVWGCVGISYYAGHVTLSGGFGFAVSYPGVGATYVGHQRVVCGPTESNSFFLSTPYGGASWDYEGDGANYRNGKLYLGASVNRPYGYGGGYVHRWNYTF